MYTPQYFFLDKVQMHAIFGMEAQVRIIAINIIGLSTYINCSVK
ncbi:MAG: hypothetical protein BAJALOKI1v1_600005 [Promethearchaeota archaeon]|nr:MAG: hypothetical protein BAJALOKI1v1_600005 [Candidatus Lokiarchaeota archaeon]